MAEPTSTRPGSSGERLVTGVTPRQKTSVYLDPLVYVPFKDTCRRTGQSTCSVLEALMFGWSRGVAAGGFQDPRPVTVNLHMERTVQRPRRLGKSVEVVEEREIQGSPDHCAWCGRTPTVTAWIRHSALVLKQPYLCSSCLHYIRGRGLDLTYRTL